MTCCATALDLEAGLELLDSSIGNRAKPMGEEQARIEVASDANIVPARAHDGLPTSSGSRVLAATLVATAISEVARNIVVHVGRGEVEFKLTYAPDRRGVVVIAVPRHFIVARVRTPSVISLPVAITSSPRAATMSVAPKARASSRRPRGGRPHGR